MHCCSWYGRNAYLLQSTLFMDDTGNYKQFILCALDYWNFSNDSVLVNDFVNETMTPLCVHEIYVKMLQEVRNIGTT